MNIATNLDEIKAQITLFEKKYHRSSGSVELLAVSKTRTPEEVSIAIEQGQRHFGENYCQEAVTKIKFINNPELIWHFIGPVQSNKTNQIAQYFDWVHTIDRLKIAKRLNDQRPANKSPLNICIQINISNEETKSGIRLEDTEDFINEINKLNRLIIRGLMVLPKASNDFNEQREPFSQLHTMLKRFKKLNTGLDTLSMGTTGDMEAAIAEGATIVRIGTAIFGPRNASK